MTPGISPEQEDDNANTNATPAQGKVGVGVLGASGYGGLELIRLMSAHPGLELMGASSRQWEGRALCDVLPGWRPCKATSKLVVESDIDAKAWRKRGIELVFSALPHGAFASRARAFLDAGIRIVDLASDFRLQTASDYPRYYGQEHPDPKLLDQAVYGLSEWCVGGSAAAKDTAVAGVGGDLRQAALVANPGCYATAILLGVLPAVAAGLWRGEPIVAHAASGVSGSGRKAQLGSHFVEVSEGLRPYKVGEKHQHLGEIRQAIGRLLSISQSDAASMPCDAEDIVFIPTLAPMRRGILAHITIPIAKSTDAQLQEIYSSAYADAAFVSVLGKDACGVDILPATHRVCGSNRVELSVCSMRGGRLLQVSVAEDNLGKGAAGQALQNANRMLGFPEAYGIPCQGWVLS